MQGIENEIVLKTGTQVKKVPPPAAHPLAGEPATKTTAGRARAHKVLEEIQSRMFWETGRRIHLYLKHEKKTGRREIYLNRLLLDADHAVPYSG